MLQLCDYICVSPLDHQLISSFVVVNQSARFVVNSSIRFVVSQSINSFIILFRVYKQIPYDHICVNRLDRQSISSPVVVNQSARLVVNSSTRFVVNQSVSSFIILFRVQNGVQTIIFVSVRSSSSISQVARRRQSVDSFCRQFVNL